MVILYYKIFKAIRERAKKKIGSGAEKERSAAASDDQAAAVVLENVAETRRLQQIPAISNTSIPIDEEPELQCHVIRNEGAGCSDPLTGVRSQGVDQDQRLEVTVTSTAEPTNGNPDSGYAPSHIEETQFCLRNPNIDLLEEDEEGEEGAAGEQEGPQRKQVIHRTDCVLANSTSRATSDLPPALASAAPAAPLVKTRKSKKLRFNLRRKEREHHKTREKTSARLERKATKTLAIVLGKRVACGSLAPASALASRH